MITKNKILKIKKQIKINIFNLVRRDIYMMYLLNLFIKIYFLFNLRIIKINTHIKLN
jgi:hypothetical protein